MKTAIEQVREELKAALLHSEIAQIDCNEGNIVIELERLDLRIDAALTALKSLEGPRLTVDEAMKAANAWADHEPHVGRYSATKQADLRARLTKSANP